MDDTIGVVEAHDIAVRAEHNIMHAVPRLDSALVHADPQSRDGVDRHSAVAHHRVRGG